MRQKMADVVTENKLSGEGACETSFGDEVGVLEYSPMMDKQHRRGLESICLSLLSAWEDENSFKRWHELERSLSINHA